MAGKYHQALQSRIRGRLVAEQAARIKACHLQIFALLEDYPNNTHYVQYSQKVLHYFEVMIANMAKQIERSVSYE